MADLWALPEDGESLFPTAEPLAADVAFRGPGGAGPSGAASSPAVIALFLCLIGFFATLMGVGKMDPTRTEPVMVSVSDAFGGARRRPIFDPAIVAHRSLAGTDAEPSDIEPTPAAMTERKGTAPVDIERLPEVELTSDALFDRLGRVRRDRLVMLGRMADAVRDSQDDDAPLLLELVAPMPSGHSGPDAASTIRYLVVLDRQIAALGLDEASIRIGTTTRSDETWRLRIVDRRELPQRAGLVPVTP